MRRRGGYRIPQEFTITDGIESVDLTKYPFNISDWSPGVPAYRDGGAFQFSPLADGRRLVDYRYENITDELTFSINGSSSDVAIRHEQKLMRLLKKAADYGATTWQTTPVYIVARSYRETGRRYALLHKGLVPHLTFPHATPFAQAFSLRSVWDELTLSLEHGIWQSSEPGSAILTPISVVESFEVGNLLTFTPQETNDDAWTEDFLTTITLNSGNLEFGLGSGGGGAAHVTGVRFRNVQIAQGTVLSNAIIRFTAGSTGSTAMNVDIIGEDVDSAAAFSTYADFASRALTTATVSWVFSTAWVSGNKYNTPSITSIVNEILARSGWTAGNDLVIFIYETLSSGIRLWGSYDSSLSDAPKLILTL